MCIIFICMFDMMLSEKYAVTYLDIYKRKNKYAVARTAFFLILI